MPNQLKSRDELPWLYYPRSNSVRVLNSHIIGGGGGGPVGLGTEVAWWSPTITGDMSDITGNGFDATLSGSASIVDDGGGESSLTMTDATGVAAIGAQLSSSIQAISFWYNTTVYAGANNHQPFNLTGGGRKIGIAVRTTGQIRVGFTDGANANTMITGTGLATSSWIHIAVNIVSHQMWVNGSSSGSLFSGDLVNAANDRFIGVATATWKIDDCRLLDTELTSGQVANLASARGYQP